MVRRWFRRHLQLRDNTNRSRAEIHTTKFNVRIFSYKTLRIATNNFSTFIGRGSYGNVFKGVLPDNGRTVAIKRQINPDRDGFLEMVEIMSHLHHVNLIQVIGCCVENDQQLLVCKYADNGSVSQLLHSKKSHAFDWERRAAVCTGIARCLSYLHHEISPRIIHRDIKPSNILLDANFVPKLADFDLIDFVAGCRNAEAGKRSAKGRTGFQYPDVDDSFTGTVKGTLGYLDPNYFVTGQSTAKVDVFSFGVVMLEIITGRKAVDISSGKKEDWMILNWVTKVREEGMVLNIVDPKLNEFPKEDVERFINVALLCTQATPEQRPSMFRVVHMLYGGHNSDLEISEMAAAAVAAQPANWSNGFSNQTLVSMSTSLTTSTSVMEETVDGSTSKRMTDASGKCSSKAARAVFTAIKEEEQSYEEDLVSK